MRLGNEFQSPADCRSAMINVRRPAVAGNFNVASNTPANFMLRMVVSYFWACTSRFATRLVMSACFLCLCANLAAAVPLYQGQGYGPYGPNPPYPVDYAGCMAVATSLYSSPAAACQAITTGLPLCERNNATTRNFVASLTTPTNCYVSWQYQNNGDTNWYGYSENFPIYTCPDGWKGRLGQSGCAPIDEQNYAQQCPTCQLGNPLLPLTGAKREVIPTGVSLGGVALTLTYDTTSKAQPSGFVPFLIEPASLGPLWRTSFHHRLRVAGSTSAVLSRGDGNVLYFTPGAGGYIATSSTPHRLTQTTSGYLFSDVETGTLEAFDGSGNLTTLTTRGGFALNFSYGSDGTLRMVQGSDGRSVGFTYANGVISSIRGPDWQTISPAYDAQGNLTSLTWPDGKVFGLLYENTALPWALTGKVDENNSRLATFGYDDAGRAISSEHTGGAQAYTLTYSNPPAMQVSSDVYNSSKDVWVRSLSWTAPGPISVNNPAGGVSTLSTQVVNGMPLVTTKAQEAGSGSASASSSLTYDSVGNVLSFDDEAGVRTCYAYDTNHRETVRVEGLQTTVDCSTVTPAGATLPAGARRITTAWHPDWKMPTSITQPLKKTSIVYNGQPDPFNGNTTANCSSAPARADGKPAPVVCKIVEQALLGTGAIDTSVPTATSSYTYDAVGRVLTSVDPRNNSTNYAYYTATSYQNNFDPALKLLLHGDGTNGSTATSDSSLYAKVLASNGSAQVSTAQSRFGSGSLYFNGSNSYFSEANDPDFVFGTGDFTIEFFMFLPIAWTSEPYCSGVVGQKLDDNHSGWVIYRDPNTPAQVRARIGAGTGSIDLNSSTTPSTGVWQHWALTKHSGVCTWWVQGVADASGACTAPLNDTAGSFWLGKSQTWGGSLNAYIDDLRITKGQARYTANFTPPSQPFPNPGPGATAVGHTQGDPQSITNAAGQALQFTALDATGRVLQISDAKGIGTRATYAPRGWVNTLTITPPAGSARTTSYSYDNAGQMTSTVLPDGTSLSYSYDAAHRLTGVTDALGNTVTYTLDASGNRIGEDLRDPGGALQRSIARSFDALNRLQQVTGASQ